MIIDALAKTIQEKQKKLDTHASKMNKSNFPKNYANSRRTENLHSWLIEHPDTARKIEMAQYIDTKEHMSLLQEARRGAQSIADAWEFGRKYSYTDLIENSQLIKLNSIINGRESREFKEEFKKHKEIIYRSNINRCESHEAALDLERERKKPYSHDFRSDEKTLNMKTYTPPSPKKIIPHLNKLRADLAVLPLKPLEKVIYTHLAIAGIQPFDDGNKRTARLIQNKGLAQLHLPAPELKIGERDHYLNSLEQGLSALYMYGDKKDNQWYKMENFFNLIAGKINVELDKQLATYKIK